MKRLLYLFACAFAVRAYIYGPALQTDVFEQWRFAYGVASDAWLDYAVGSDYRSLNIVPDIEWNATESANAVPFIAYPVAIVHNIPLLNGTAFVTTPELLRKLITNNTVTWNDPDILQYNPQLAVLGSPVRMYFNIRNSPVNQLIMDYLWENTTEYNSSFVGLAARRYQQLQGDAAVLSAVSSIVNSMAIVPLPYVRLSGSTSIRTGRIVTDESTGDTTGVADAPSYYVYRDDRKLLLAQSGGWPLSVTLYVHFEERHLHCGESVDALRFFYWSFGEDALVNVTVDRGYYMFSPTIANRTREHLLDARCTTSGKILTYNNLSEVQRSDVIFGLAFTLTVIFIGLVVAAWLLLPQRKKPIVAVNHCVVLVGLLLSLAAYIVWWYSPSKDSLCTSRMWLLDLGYTNVVASVYIYAFIMNHVYVLRKNVDKLSRNPINWRHFAIAYSILWGLELAILLLTQFIEHPHAEEVLVDYINWETRYVCVNEVDIMPIVARIYFCVVSVFGFYVLFKLWKKDSPGNVTWLLASFFFQIFSFVILILQTSIIPFTDDQVYAITVLLYLFAIGVIILSFFVPNIIDKVKLFAQDLTKSRTSRSESYNGNKTSVDSSEDIELP
jgi:MFS family permease/ABC-type phosphate transport system substrate-binding protein